jgi:urease accessory protein UreF
MSARVCSMAQRSETNRQGKEKHHVYFDKRWWAQVARLLDRLRELQKQVQPPAGPLRQGLGTRVHGMAVEAVNTPLAESVDVDEGRIHGAETVQKWCRWGMMHGWPRQRRPPKQSTCPCLASLLAA